MVLNEPGDKGEKELKRIAFKKRKGNTAVFPFLFFVIAPRRNVSGISFFSPSIS